MERMNFSTHAVESLRHYAQLLNQENNKYADYVGYIAEKIDEAQKFMLPEFGQILGFEGKNVTQVVRDYVPVFRLPFPATVLEYHHRRDDWVKEDGMAYDAVVVLALETEAPAKGRYEITIIPVARMIVKSGKVWHPANFAAKLSWDGEKIIGAHMPIVQDGEDLVSRIGWEEARKHALSDTKNESAAVTQLLAALSCGNVHAVECQAPEALNKKRKAKNKDAVPLYSYKVLDIGAQGGAAKRGAGNSLHASPRVHLRRGHIRRLPNASTTWVQSCVVGSEKNGAIAKSYRIKA